ncbi:unnamed protein product [Phyllotreta striolata]|uniref:Uncharacterized protein n=1 Tax=Phyllotreta striolata TaxID=444603 RepID=A0A9N9TIW9_PHYSR|nr:unnamed protein product [Phyllotreta striolata]
MRSKNTTYPTVLLLTMVLSMSSIVVDGFEFFKLLSPGYATVKTEGGFTAIRTPPSEKSAPVHPLESFIWSLIQQMSGDDNIDIIDQGPESTDFSSNETEDFQTQVAQKQFNNFWTFYF